MAISIGPAASGRRQVPLKGERENSNQAILREQALDDLSMLLSWKEKHRVQDEWVFTCEKST